MRLSMNEQTFILHQCLLVCLSTVAILYKDGTLDTPAHPYSTLTTDLLQVHPKVIQGIVHEVE